MRHVCFYDGQCGLCRGSTTLLYRLDWLGRLEFRDMQAHDLPVRPELAMRGMTMRTPGGRILIGFPAVRRALLQTPLGASLAAVLYLPGISAVAARVYRVVATRRRRDACANPPSPSIRHA
jgi:predicted DCC family thiol-disulfide oxidoreductase YuxK